ncbi:MAG TPA: acylphosphatase [Alphaproteobacteria bacterium]|nr:acylphosphatase [Alphaproteobacteria bacterium]MDP6269656.1 acylphosphatase [Alphaproteobacteria bacterium]MDP7427302.1 acylphosphatase [Alphaproteobacteria bacterium]HJM50469.1 acylphosphatase [Alphaproteobacteria bacterium]
MNTPGQKAARVHIFGRVQGVWFRGWTVTTAVDLDVEGWVRNRRDGSVEGLFVGPEVAVDALVEACRRGPGAAVVLDVQVQPADDEEAAAVSGQGFRQAATI